MYIEHFLAMNGQLTPCGITGLDRTEGYSMAIHRVESRDIAKNLFGKFLQYHIELPYVVDVSWVMQSYALMPKSTLQIIKSSGRLGPDRMPSDAGQSCLGKCFKRTAWHKRISKTKA